MKKILILILFILTFRNYSQTLDTSKFALERELLQGYYSYVINKSEYFGYGAGEIQFPLTFDLNLIDTANWRLIRNLNNGLYDKAENKTDWYGYPAGTVRAQLYINTEAMESGYTDYSYDDLLQPTISAEQKLIRIQVTNYDGNGYRAIQVFNPLIKLNSIIVVNYDYSGGFLYNKILYTFTLMSGGIVIYFQSTVESQTGDFYFYVAIIN